MMQNNIEFTETVSPVLMTKRAPKHFRIDFEQHKDDQLKTGVIAALVGGFSLTNSWNMEMSGSLLDTSSYVLAIVAVHGCTCSALISAFLYRTLTRSGPKEAVLWMEKHYVVALLPYIKFILGVIAYLSSVILIAIKELSDAQEAKVFTLIIGLIGIFTAMGTLMLVHLDCPGKVTSGNDDDNHASKNISSSDRQSRE
jgi:hypothetical protein